MRRTRTKLRQRLLFHPPLNIPKWEQLSHNTQRKVISRLAIMLRRHRKIMVDGKEADDE